MPTLVLKKGAYGILDAAKNHDTVPAIQTWLCGDAPLFILRNIGRFLILLAACFASLGLYVWLTGQAMDPLGFVWFQAHSQSLNDAEVFVGRVLMIPGFWRDAILPYLKLPAWEALLGGIITLLIVGGLLLAIGRRRRRRRVV